MMTRDDVSAEITMIEQRIVTLQQNIEAARNEVAQSVRRLDWLRGYEAALKAMEDGADKNSDNDSENSEVDGSVVLS